MPTCICGHEIGVHRQNEWSCNAIRCECLEFVEDLSRIKTQELTAELARRFPAGIIVLHQTGDPLGETNEEYTPAWWGGTINAIGLVRLIETRLINTMEGPQ